MRGKICVEMHRASAMLPALELFEARLQRAVAEFGCILSRLLEFFFAMDDHGAIRSWCCVSRIRTRCGAGGGCGAVGGAPCGDRPCRTLGCTGRSWRRGCRRTGILRWCRYGSWSMWFVMVHKKAHRRYSDAPCMAMGVTGCGLQILRTQPGGGARQGVHGLVGDECALESPL